MGSFANSLFTLMLGWLQSVFSLMWKSISANHESSLVLWLSNHWMLLAVLICLIGEIADLIIYLFRWRPLQVWQSFFRRIRNRKADQEIDPAPIGMDLSDKPFTDRNTASFDDKSQRFAAMMEETELAYSHRENAEASLRNSRRRRFSPGFFAENGQKINVSVAPQEVFNPEDTYHQPIYPRKWRSNIKQDESTDENI